jgi:hypothetical protein
MTLSLDPANQHQTRQLLITDIRRTTTELPAMKETRMRLSNQWCALSLPAAVAMLAATAAMAAQPTPTTPTATAAPPATATAATGTAMAVPEDEITEVKHAKVEKGPIVVNWKFRKHEGEANLTVNEDGTWLFSGHYANKHPDKDFEVVLGLKSSDGGTVLFQDVNDASSGQWSKQGQSKILKDDFKSFMKHEYMGHYHFSESAEGRHKAFVKREERREKAKKEEEREKIAKEEAEQAKRAAQQQQQSGGGGSSSVWSTVGSVAATIGGTLLSFL